MNSKPNLLKCNQCHAEYSLDDRRWDCECGHYLDIQFTASLKPEKIKRDSISLWRYREAIPVSREQNIISFGEGMTPLINVQINQTAVYLKMDFLFPTGSFKDRGASVMVSKAKELGIDVVVEDSSGNAGASISAYCARAGIKCHIFVPRATSPAKLAQINAYGAHLHLIDGDREATARAAREKAKDMYYASHVMNPFFLQGTKTFAYEICEQLKWTQPEMIFLPVGNGTLLLGAFLGFKDLMENGIVNEMPRLIAVQAQNCAPLYHLVHPGAIPPDFSRKTMAQGIAIRFPIREAQILGAVKETNGEIIRVNESEIKDSINELNSKGFYVEPSSAVAAAGFTRYHPKPDPSTPIVIALTGHGLKVPKET